MINFLDWLENEFVAEAFSAQTIKEYKPSKEGWIKKSNSYEYGFNVPGDDDCFDDYCYKVYFKYVGGDSVSIGFDRQGRVAQTGLNAANDVFMSVLRAIDKFLFKKKPSEISWQGAPKDAPTSVGPNKGWIVNTNARENIYDKWAIRHLFPQRYVSVRSGYWIRRDIYDNKVQAGVYPAIPSNITQFSSPGQKITAIEEMRKISKNQLDTQNPPSQIAREKEAEIARSRNAPRMLPRNSQ